MHAEFERVDEIVRVFVDGDTYGDPWVWIAAVRHLAADRIRLVGVVEVPSAEAKQALFAACRKRGWTHVKYSRRQNGEWVDRVIEVPA